MPRRTVHPLAAHTTREVKGKRHDVGVRRKDVKSRYSERTRGGGYKATYEVGQTEAFPTKILPGQFKVALPHGRLRSRGFYRPAS